MQVTQTWRNRFYYRMGFISARLGVNCWFEDWRRILHKVEILYAGYRTYNEDIISGNMKDGALDALEEELEMLIMQLLPSVSVIFNRGCGRVITIRTGLGYDLDI